MHLLQIYFWLWECKIYQTRLRFARVINISLLPRFLCPAVYNIVAVFLANYLQIGNKDCTLKADQFERC